jgi:hypothetical protein
LDQEKSGNPLISFSYYDFNARMKMLYICDPILRRLNLHLQRQRYGKLERFFKAEKKFRFQNAFKLTFVGLASASKVEIASVEGPLHLLLCF